MSHQKPWAESMTYLMQLPGFGVITAHDGAGRHWGDPTFRERQTSGELFGIDTRAGAEWDQVPGERHHQGRAQGTEVGNGGSGPAGSEVRPGVENPFQELQKRMHRNQAIVAVARRLLELVWYVLTRRQPYRHFSQERIAYKYLTWAWQMDEAARDGLTRQQFTRYYLMRLGIGHDLTRIALDPKHPRKIATEAELLALRPELNHIE